MQALRELDTFLAAGGFTDVAEFGGGLDQLDHALAEQGMVVDDQDGVGNGRILGEGGNCSVERERMSRRAAGMKCSVTRGPAAGRFSTLNWPPRFLARSSMLVIP